MRKNWIRTENSITVAIKDKVATNRRGTKVAKSRYKASKVLFSHRDRAFQSLEEHLTTDVEVAAYVEALTHKLAETEAKEDHNMSSPEIPKVSQLRGGLLRAVLDAWESDVPAAHSPGRWPKPSGRPGP